MWMWDILLVIHSNSRLRCVFSKCEFGCDCFCILSCSHLSLTDGSRFICHEARFFKFFMYFIYGFACILKLVKKFIPNCWVIRIEPLNVTLSCHGTCYSRSIRYATQTHITCAFALILALRRYTNMIPSNDVATNLSHGLWYFYMPTLLHTVCLA